LRRFAALWFVLLLVVCALIGAKRAGCPGCIDMNRDNPTCEWRGDAQFRFDAANPAHHQHLVSDAQLAEEIAIRSADAEHGRLYGFEGHGGLVDRGRVRNACMARLVSRIQSNHGVTAQQIQVARGQRSPAFDLAATLLFFPFYWLGAMLLASAVWRRFSADERRVRVVAFGVASIALAFVFVLVLQLWLVIWEVIRVGNGHISGFRAATARQWPQQHLALLFAASLAGCWLAASLRRVVPWIVPVASSALSGGILISELFQRFPVLR
jgi:hypothetical protein